MNRDRVDASPEEDEVLSKETKEEEEALAREWEKESFAASDPQANY